MREPFIPKAKQIEENVKLLFGDGFTVDFDQFDGDGFEILENGNPFGGIGYDPADFVHPEPFGVWVMLYDTGDRWQPPDWYDRTIGDAATYYGALRMLALAYATNVIDNKIEAMGMAGE